MSQVEPSPQGRRGLYRVHLPPPAYTFVYDAHTALVTGPGSQPRSLARSPLLRKQILLQHCPKSESIRPSGSCNGTAWVGQLASRPISFSTSGRLSHAHAIDSSVTGPGFQPIHYWRSEGMADLAFADKPIRIDMTAILDNTQLPLDVRELYGTPMVLGIGEAILPTLIKVSTPNGRV